LVVSGGGFHDTWDLKDAQTTQPLGHKALVVNVVVVGTFEEEEEGIGIAGDVKVQG